MYLPIKKGKRWNNKKEQKNKKEGLLFCVFWTRASLTIGPILMINHCLQALGANLTGVCSSPIIYLFISGLFNRDNAH